MPGWVDNVQTAAVVLTAALAFDVDAAVAIDILLLQT